MQALTILHACEFRASDITTILPILLGDTAITAPSFLLSIEVDKVEQKKVIACAKGDHIKEVKNKYLGKVATLTQVKYSLS